MISTDFASNETFEDAVISSGLFIRPDTNQAIFSKVKKLLLSYFPGKKNFLTFFLSGRSALFYLFKQLHLPKGSEVLIQGFTCEAVVLPIIKSNLTPVFVDIEEERYGMDPIDLEKKITKKSKVLIIQHTYGIPPKREKLLEIAKKYHLLVVEDLAHGFSEELFKTDTKETIKLLSFGRSKPFSSVFGGAVITSDVTLAKKLENTSQNLSPLPSLFLRKLLLYKPLTVLIQKTYGIVLGKILHKLTQHTGLLVPEITKKEKEGTYDTFTDYQYPPSLARLLLIQLQRYKKTAQNRYDSVLLYNQLLHKTVPPHALIRYPLRVKNPQDVKRKCLNKQIFLGNWYDQVIAPKQIDITRLGYKKGMCPKAEKITQEIINLPTHISKDQATLIASLITQYEN